MRGSDTNPCNVSKIWDAEQTQNVDYTTHVADVNPVPCGKGRCCWRTLLVYSISGGVEKKYAMISKRNFDISKFLSNYLFLLSILLIKVLCLLLLWMRGSDTNPCNVSKIWDVYQVQNGINEHKLQRLTTSEAYKDMWRGGKIFESEVSLLS